MRSWTLPFLIRHSAFHVMDHAWEMEDKDRSGEAKRDQHVAGRRELDAADHVAHHAATQRRTEELLTAPRFPAAPPA